MTHWHFDSNTPEPQHTSWLISLSDAPIQATSGVSCCVFVEMAARPKSAVAHLAPPCAVVCIGDVLKPEAVEKLGEYILKFIRDTFKIMQQAKSRHHRQKKLRLPSWSYVMRKGGGAGLYLCCLSYFEPKDLDIASCVKVDEAEADAMGRAMLKRINFQLGMISTHAGDLVGLVEEESKTEMNTELKTPTLAVCKRLLAGGDDKGQIVEGNRFRRVLGRAFIPLMQFHRALPQPVVNIVTGKTDAGRLLVPMDKSSAECTDTETKMDTVWMTTFDGAEH